MQIDPCCQHPEKHSFVRRQRLHFSIAGCRRALQVRVLQIVCRSMLDTCVRYADRFLPSESTQTSSNIQASMSEHLSLLCQSANRATDKKAKAPTGVWSG